MTLRIITQPAVEPVSVAEVMAWSRIDSSSAEPAPGAITAVLASPVAPGNVENGAHRYLATFTTAAGETQAGTVSAAVTVADKTVNGQVSLTAIPLGGSLVTGRKLYRTVAGGTTYLLLATIANNTATVYTDNIADASLGAGAPSVSTTADPLLTMLIGQAREDVEVNGVRLITQTWERVYDAFPSNELKLGLLPIQSIESVKYYDSAGVLQTLGVAAYTFDNTLPGWLLPAYGTSWPSTYAVSNAVIVRFVAGFGDAGSDVPFKIRSWISSRVKLFYDYPDGMAPTNVQRLPFVDELLNEHRILQIA